VIGPGGRMLALGRNVGRPTLCRSYLLSRKTSRSLIGRVRVGRFVASCRNVWLAACLRWWVGVSGSPCSMERSMATRKSITKAQATRYRSGSRAAKTEVLITVCAVTGLNRDYALRALKRALKPRVVRPRSPFRPRRRVRPRMATFDGNPSAGSAVSIGMTKGRHPENG
jgi:hypothetical protein